VNKQLKQKFKFTRRKTQIALGIFWLIDMLFQLQPKMFSQRFIDNNILPNSVGQPFVVYGPMHFFSHIFLLSPVVMNVLIILIQLAIAILIFNKRTAKIGLLISIFWGLFVWYIGEGLGGILLGGGNGSLLMGAPGAALLYVILAVAAIPNTKEKTPSQWLIFAWAIIWIGLGINQLLPTHASLVDISSMIMQNTRGAPGWLFFLNSHVASALYNIASKTSHATANNIMTGMMSTGSNLSKALRGYWFVVLMSLVEIIIGLGVFIGHIGRRAVLIGSIVMSLFFWLVGQSLGQFYSGYATDLNTAPIMILFALILLGMSPELTVYLKRIKLKIEKFII